MREHLVGYVLGVLDDAEHEEIEKGLDADPQLRRDLERIRSHLAPLESSREPFDSPPGLAERTCVRVAELADSEKPLAGRAAVALQPEPPRTRFTAADAVVAVGVVLAASIFFFPAVTHSRFQARVAACQNNLRQLHVALRQYSSRDEDGCFPRVPAEGNRAFAGLCASVLSDAGYLTEPRTLLCPASPLAEEANEFRVSTLDQIDQAQGEQLERLQRMAGGSFGSCLGYQKVDNQGQVHTYAVKDLSRDYFVLMADAPQLIPSGGNSKNHGQRGQNVLYEGGGVKYLVTRLEERSGDDFFVSARGIVEAGLHLNDSVIGNSAAPPILVPVGYQPQVASP